MKNKAYSSFQDIWGNQYNFDNYLDFSGFWFNIPYQERLRAFSAEIFKKLQYAADMSNPEFGLSTDEIRQFSALKKKVLKNKIEKIEKELVENGLTEEMRNDLFKLLTSLRSDLSAISGALIFAGIKPV